MPSLGSKPTIGFLVPSTLGIWRDWTNAFEQRLIDLNWPKGSIEINYQQAEGIEKNYTKHAKYFVGLPVNVIVTGGTQATKACKNAAAAKTPPIPVVFATAGDPIDTKLVPSFSAPGNVTGISNQQTNLVIKRLDYLRQLLGNARIALVGNDRSPNVRLEMKIAQQIAPALGLKVTVAKIHKKEDIARVIRSLKGKVAGLLICTDPLITTHAALLNNEAMQAQLPTMHAFAEYVHKYGGFISYGPHFPDLFVSAAELVNTILTTGHRLNMADVPVQQPNNFEVAINIPLSKRLGLDVPASLLALANKGD